ncbi:hypothetical protein CPB83DRAFT_858313 [Crepidotus variabilis]|uniref:Uncharacterized protein n=1 Tax=Crepidotus variabilis TaxID=179855 RepID=A0A9P6JMR6_9AGAR|nr:hypothetical protein CPB83DRAFT_858313 [Crepidotus variabilis]
MKYTLSTFLVGQLWPMPPVLRKDLSEKTAIVIGSNTGIGYETAKHFASMGVTRLVLAVRNREKGEAARKQLEEETGFRNAEVGIVDLTSFESVGNFVKEFEKNLDARLDILVLNAAIFPQLHNSRTKDGWETSHQTNHLSTSLLALLFLPLLSSTAKKYDTTPRVVVLTSGTHYRIQFDKNLIESENPLRHFDSKDYFDPQNAGAAAQQGRYNETKLLNVFFARALAARTPASHTYPTFITTAVNPGLSYSAGLNPDTDSRILKVAVSVLRFIFARSQEQAARQAVWGALADEAGINGSYITETTITESSDYVIGDEGVLAEEKLWNNLVDELSKINLKVQEIVDRYLTIPVPH